MNLLKVVTGCVFEFVLYKLNNNLTSDTRTIIVVHSFQQSIFERLKTNCCGKIGQLIVLRGVSVNVVLLLL